VGAAGDVMGGTGPTTGRVRFELAGGPAALRPAAERIALAVIAAGATGTPLHDLVLAVHELLANALEHGHLGDPTIPVVAEVTRDQAGAVVVRVVDRARGGRWHPAVSSEHPLAVRGRGLALARALSDRVQLVTEGDRTVVELTVR
jgi:anti-sigma regulatory factor (Ser/Thr protein kinase)